MSRSRGPQSSRWPEKAMSFWKSTGARMGQLSCTTAGYLQKEAQTGRKLLSTTLSSNPTPHLGPAFALAGELPGTSEYFPGGGEGETGHRYEALPTLPSQLCWFMSFHTRQILGGTAGEEGISSPCRKELGQGEGSSGSRIQRKSCVWGKRWH